MKKTTQKLFALGAIFLLASCQGPVGEVDYNLYTKEPLVAANEDFRILQLSDIHFSLASHFTREWLYFDELISQANPNLIVVTGDVFMNASHDVVHKLYSYFDSKEIAWTVTFGNHDLQGFYSPQFITGQALYDNYDYSYYVDVVDDLNGHGNHYINLVKDGKVKWQFFMLDSGSYHKTGFTYKYDVIHENQIDWYERVIVETNKKEHGVDNFDHIDPNDVIPSLAFFHIPLFEYEEAWNAYEEGLIDGDGVLEDSGIWYGYENTGFFERAKQLHSTKGVFVGHDHTNNFAINYQGIILAYGVKSGRGIYHNPEQIGGRIINVHMDGSLSTETLFVSYDDLN